MSMISPTLTNAGASDVLMGSVTRYVSNRGSHWGQITPDGDDRQVFFNQASLFHASDFALMQVGQKVRFEEESDPVNVSHAVRMSPVHAEPYTDFSRSSGR